MSREQLTDSTGKPVSIGDRVRFRGKEYTIKDFTSYGGRHGTATIEFVEEQHTEETADEISIDLVSRANA